MSSHHRKKKSSAVSSSSCKSANQLCLTLGDPMDCSSPDSSVHGILQARILEWVAMSSSGDLPDPGVRLVSPVTLPLQADSLLLSYRGSPPSRSYLNLITSQRTTSENHHTGGFNMWIFRGMYSVWGFPADSDGKESTHNAGVPGLIPVWGRSPEEGDPLYYPCLENSMDRGAWQATDHGIPRVRHAWATKSQPPKV